MRTNFEEKTELKNKIYVIFLYCPNKKKTIYRHTKHQNIIFFEGLHYQK